MVSHHRTVFFKRIGWLQHAVKWYQIFIIHGFVHFIVNLRERGFDYPNRKKTKFMSKDGNPIWHNHPHHSKKRYILLFLPFGTCNVSWLGEHLTFAQSAFLALLTPRLFPARQIATFDYCALLHWRNGTQRLLRMVQRWNKITSPRLSRKEVW